MKIPTASVPSTCHKDVMPPYFCWIQTSRISWETLHNPPIQNFASRILGGVTSIQPKCSKNSSSDQLVVEPTHLKNVRKSNWIISPSFGVKIPKIFEVPPPSRTIRESRWTALMNLSASASPSMYAVSLTLLGHDAWKKFQKDSP